MKRIITCFVAVSLVLAMASGSLAAVKKKAPPQKKPAYKRVDLPPPSSPAAKAKVARTRGFAAKGGLLGGAGAVEIGYLLPIGAVDAGIYAGYGIGNSYNLMLAQLEGLFKISSNNFYLSADYAGYSEKVRNVPGISGDVEKGGRIGLGVAYGKQFEKWEGRLGYSTILGLTATAGYKF